VGLIRLRVVTNHRVATNSVRKWFDRLVVLLGIASIVMLLIGPDAIPLRLIVATWAVFGVLSLIDAGPRLAKRLRSSLAEGGLWDDSPADRSATDAAEEGADVSDDGGRPAKL
jgi:hypothetical protein